MKEVLWAVWDDLDNANGLRTRAQATVHVGFGGHWWELDLGAENLARLQEELRPWLAAGKQVKDVPASRRVVAIEDGEVIQRRQQPGIKARDWERGRAWGKAIREFARKEGISFHTTTCTCEECHPEMDEHSEPQIYYSRELRDAYAASIGME